MTTQVIQDVRYKWSCLRAVLLAFLFLVVLLFTLAGAFFALAAALLLFTLGQGLKALQEIIFPRLEVCLDAAVSAFHHVAVAFPAAHDACCTQHPQPLVHIFANLEVNFIWWNFKAEAVALLVISSEYVFHIQGRFFIQIKKLNKVVH